MAVRPEVQVVSIFCSVMGSKMDRDPSIARRGSGGDTCMVDIPADILKGHVVAYTM